MMDKKKLKIFLRSDYTRSQLPYVNFYSLWVLKAAALYDGKHYKWIYL